MKADEVARHQKDRLEGAILEAVARHGLASTTVRELVTLAGVSKSTFYEHFASKEECFLATFDSIVAEMAEEVAKAYGSGGDERERLVSALRRFMEFVVERPDATAFAIVDSLTLGSAGIAHREGAWEAFEQLARQYFVNTAPQEEVSDLTVRAIIAGITGVTYGYLRSGRTAELPAQVEPLIDWALSYQGPDSEAVLRAVAAAERPCSIEIDDEGDEGEPGWDEPPDSPLSRATLSQRQRIIRAAGRVAVDRGYESLSIPTISAAGGTSNQTFYENFNSKRDAFIAAYEIASNKALRFTAKALKGQTDGPEAAGAALRALTEYIANDRMYARLAFLEMMTAGPPALERSEETTKSVVAFIEAGKGPKGIGVDAPRIVLDATAAGIWFVIQREVAHGRDASLPAKAPELARLALAPLSTAG
ncbi:MAG TPA: TetR/AcrR family transcriptional regulator [Solirubrobacterales bacterium]|nr:TetR/AcrR family transcriptional regulator [Solirubrobacterales bacterium]